MKIKPALQRGLLRFGSLRSPTLRKPRCKVLHIFPLFQHFKDRFFFLFPDVIWRKYRSSIVYPKPFIVQIYTVFLEKSPDFVLETFFFVVFLLIFDIVNYYISLFI